MFLQKCISILLSSLMLVSTGGLAFNVHFCGENIAGIAYANINDEFADSENCCIEKAKENKSCCSDKVVKIKGKSDIITKNFDLKAAFSPAVLSFNEICFLPSGDEVFVANLNFDHAPVHGPPLYKLFKQLIFYA